jgi:nitrogenase-stabilizing/protective protein
MILATLAKLSTAEQFFETLSVPFEQEALNIHRLHVLKRFRELVRAQGDDASEESCRLALATAYEEFVEGKGRKTFKVFKDSMPGFVSLSDIRRG